MRLYLAGPMRGFPKYNFDAFETEAIRLRTAGYEVISPSEINIQDGMDYTSEETVEATVRRDANGLPDEEYYLERDFKALETCEGIALIAGWANSSGVRQEINFGLVHNLPIHLIDYWLENPVRENQIPKPGSEIIMVDPDTGARKGQKLARFDLIPVKPLWELAEHYGRGASKYAEHNWARGYNWHLCYSSALHHLAQFWAGENIDEETGSKHVIAAAWHCLTLAYYMEVNKQKDDRPHTVLGTENVPEVPH